MMRKLKSIDGLLLFLYICIVSFGIINIHSVLEANGMKQLMWFGLAVGVGIILFFLNGFFYENIAPLAYIFGVIVLAGVLAFGVTINGAKAWYQIGSVLIQPVEFTKVTTALFLAAFCASPNFNFSNLRDMSISMGIIILPMIILLFQPDVGSLLVFCSFFIVLYRLGLSGWWFILGGFFALVFLLSIYFKDASYQLILIFVLIFLALFLYFNFFVKRFKFTMQLIIASLLFMGITFAIIFVTPTIFEKLPPHHQDRINVLLYGESISPDNAGYNLLYSKSAIAVGEWVGVGYDQGTVTQGRFVPEQWTDYIFSAVGEEWGFVGCFLLILAYTLFIGRIYYLAENQKKQFNRLYGYAVASIFLFHFAMNIGMVIGLFPTVGIPLPFFSYGGSSLLAFSILFFIFLRLNYSDKQSLI